MHSSQEQQEEQRAPPPASAPPPLPLPPPPPPPHPHPYPHPHPHLLPNPNPNPAPSASSAAPPGSSKAVVFDNLREGFRRAKARRDGINVESSGGDAGGARPPHLSSVLVNVIDPSSTPSFASINVTPKKGEKSGNKPASHNSSSPSSLGLFERLEATLSNLYGNRLPQVKVTSPRTGTETSPRGGLRVKAALVPSHGGFVVAGDDDPNVSGLQKTNGTASGSGPIPPSPGLAAPDVLGRGGDPAEWHRSPYCHLYLVSGCDSLEAYRTRVKPSLLVFLSQIGANGNPADASASSTGSASSNNAGGSSSSGVGAATGHAGSASSAGCSQYMIVFVPSVTRSSVAAAAAAVGASASASARGGAADSSSFDPEVAPAAARLGGLLTSRLAAVAAGRPMARGGATPTATGVPATATTTTLSSTAAASVGTLYSVSSATEPAPRGGGGENSNIAGTSAALSAALPPHVVLPISTSANSLSHLTKTDRELARRLASDFPLGNVCVLSSLLLVDPPPSDGAGGKSSKQQDAAEPHLLEIQRREWSLFLKALGTAVVDGFAERCKRYQREIKEMDRIRSLVATSPAQDSGAAAAVSNKMKAQLLEARVEAFRSRRRLDLGYYFLVKESLALTYEQMNLPSEALLEYDEMKAVVPDLRLQPNQSRGPQQSGSSSTALTKAPLPSELSLDEDELSQMALRGDTDAFRARLNAETLSSSSVATGGGHASGLLYNQSAFQQTWMSLAPVLHQYLFARATALLFDTGRLVEVAARCVSFLESTYRFRLSQLLSESSDHNRAAVERWAFDFAWGIKEACDSYLEEDVSEASSAAAAAASDAAIDAARHHQLLDESSERSDPHRRGTIASNAGPALSSSATAISENRSGGSGQTLARSVCDVVEFARKRLMKVGDLAFANKNPVRSQGRAVANELESPWRTWKPRTADHNHCPDEDSSSHAEEDPGGDVMVESALVPPMDLVGRAATSPDSFVTCYLELLQVLEAHNRFSGRTRRASRLCVEIAGLHVRRGDRYKAAQALRIASRAYSEEKWEACHFLLLFRLAGYQREVSTADDYVDTLVHCFGPSRWSTAPVRAQDCLLADLEAVLRSSWVSRKRIASVPLFDPVIGIDGFKPSARSGSARDLLKKVYTVGDRASVTLSIESFLPREIEADGLSVELVPFRVYVSAMEDSTSIKDDEVFAALKFNSSSPVKIRPGSNVFSIDWVPTISGQFVLARATLTWKSVKFSYAAADLKRPVLRVDVIPPEPTQTLEIIPGYLLPGHEQPLKLVFCAGSDIVSRGTIKLACSPGLLLLPPGVDTTADSPESAWVSSLELPLPDRPIGAEGAVEVGFVVCFNGAAVETSGGEEAGSPPSLRASIRTWYRPPLPSGAGSGTIPEGVDEPVRVSNSNLLEHELTATAHPLSSQALSLNQVELLPYSLDRALLQIAVQCNCPGALLIRGWDLCLPPFLNLFEDLSECLNNSTILLGETFYLSFDCTFSHPPTLASSKEPSLLSSLSPPTPASVPPHVRVSFRDEETGQCFDETLPIGLRRPAIADRASLLLPRLSLAVKISIETLSSEGPVGVPIPLEIRVDPTAELRKLGVPIQYRVTCNPGDWIVSGPIQGLLLLPNPSSPPSDPAKAITSSLEEKETVLMIRIAAIPVRPGAICEYPGIRLFYCPSAGSHLQEAPCSSPYNEVENVVLVHNPVGPFLCQAEEVHYAVVASPWPVPAAATRTFAV